MGRTNIVAEAASSARRAVLAAIIGAVALVTALTSESVYFSEQHHIWTGRVTDAYAAANTVTALLERQTYAAQMAVTTGSSRWIEHYRELGRDIDAAFAIAQAIAPVDGGSSFDAEVREPMQTLNILADEAFTKIGTGALDDARKILASAAYIQTKSILSDAIDGFAQRAIDRNEAEHDALFWIEMTATSIIVPIALIAATQLWRRLNARLSRSVGAYLAAEAQIQKLALTDALTGLANRTSLLAGLRHAMARAKAQNGKLAVLMIDLDRFKPINDHCGHLVGDQVLQTVAERLGATIRNSELCGRFGGDEFVAVVEYRDDDSIPRRVGQRVIDALSRPIELADQTLEIGASVGVAVYPVDSCEEEDLISKADIALYRAKSDGRGTVTCFDPSMDDDIKERAELETELRLGIERNQVVPYYQPLIDLATGSIIGFEVLARWHHPTRGVVPPSAFIPVAEKANLIDALTLSLLQAICRDASALPDTLTFAMNVSPRQIQDMQLALRILSTLTGAGINPARFEVELTETALVSNIDAAKSVIANLKSLGIKVALDDFGTGYSSLAYLSDLSFDKIKIDRSFIKTMHERTESAKIVAAIVSLCKSLGVPTIAEGVEREIDEEVLRAMGCSIAQGYLYSEPVPFEKIPRLIERLSLARAA